MLAAHARRAAAAAAVLLLWSVSPGAAETLDLAQLRARLAGHEHVRYDFIYEQPLPHLGGVPLITRGWLIISATHGVHVRQTFPIVLEYTVTEDFIARRLPFGERRFKTGETHPKYVRYRPLLRGFVRGDYAVLGTFFDLELTDLGGGEWQLRLTPRDEELSGKLQALQLRGHDYLSEVVMWDRHGEPRRVELLHAADLVADEGMTRYFTR